MTTPDPLADFQRRARRQLIKLAVQQGWSLVVLNDILIGLELRPYRQNGTLFGTLTVTWSPGPTGCHERPRSLATSCAR